MTMAIGSMGQHAALAGLLGGGAATGGLGMLGGALIGGQLLSGLGGIMGAASSNRQARQWQDEQQRNDAINNNRRGYTYFGMGPTEDLMSAGNYTAGTPASRNAAYGRWEQAIGGPVMGQYNRLAEDVAQGGADVSRGYYADTQRLRQLGSGNVGQVQGMYGRNLASLLGGFDAGAADLTTRVDEFGRGQEQRIRRDAERDRTSADAQAKTALSMAGLGKSTAISNAMAGNRRRTSEARDDALTNLADAQIDRSVGLRRGLLTERTGYQADSNQRATDALERGLGTNLSNEYARSAGQTQLDEAALNRNAMYRGNNLNLLLNQVQGITQGGSTQYIPQYSVAGTALNSAGQGLGSLASLLALQQIYGRNG